MRSSVHGVCGLWGVLAVGLFATTGSSPLGADGFDGLFYGGGADQLVSQFIGAISIIAWVAVTAAILFLALKYTIGLRVSEQEELEGLDVHEHGAPGYGIDEFGVASDALA